MTCFGVFCQTTRFQHAKMTKTCSQTHFFWAADQNFWLFFTFFHPWYHFFGQFRVSHHQKSCSFGKKPQSKSFMGGIFSRNGTFFQFFGPPNSNFLVSWVKILLSWRFFHEKNGHDGENFAHEGQKNEFGGPKFWKKWPFREKIPPINDLLWGFLPNVQLFRWCQTRNWSKKWDHGSKKWKKVENFGRGHRKSWFYHSIRVQTGHQIARFVSRSVSADRKSWLYHSFRHPQMSNQVI